MPRLDWTEAEKKYPRGTFISEDGGLWVIDYEQEKRMVESDLIYACPDCNDDESDMRTFFHLTRQVIVPDEDTLDTYLERLIDA